MSLLEKESVLRVKKLLKKYNESFDVILLSNSAKTANEAASSLNCEVGAIVKSLVFKTEKNLNYFWLLVIKKPH